MIAPMARSTRMQSKGVDEVHHHSSGSQEGRRSARDGSVEWYDSEESSHDSRLYVSPAEPLEQTYGCIPV
jgi:hypothetical protein